MGDLKLRIHLVVVVFGVDVYHIVDALSHQIHIVGLCNNLHEGLGHLLDFLGPAGSRSSDYQLGQHLHEGGGQFSAPFVDLDLLVED